MLRLVACGSAPLSRSLVYRLLVVLGFCGMLTPPLGGAAWLLGDVDTDLTPPLVFAAGMLANYSSRGAAPFAASYRPQQQQVRERVLH